MDEMIYEMNHILNRGYEIKLSYDPRSYGQNFSAVQYMIHFIYHFSLIHSSR